MIVWRETHWHELKRGDKVITVWDDPTPNTLIQETVHKVELVGQRVAVIFKDGRDNSTAYTAVMDAPQGHTNPRFFRKETA